MKTFVKLCSIAIALALVLAGCASPKEEPKVSESTKPVDSLAAKIRSFAPTDITADISHLSEGDQKALDKLIEASKLLDPLFLRQVWSGNAELLKKLESDASAEGRERMHYFMINKGPWARQEQNKPFIDGVPHEKPPNAGYYPDDLTKDEFNSWVATLPEQEKQRATGFFTVIRRGPDGKLKIVPYHEEYREFLEPAAKLLKEAAELTSNQTLKN